MTKKEKIIAAFFILSFVLLVSSSIFTFYQLKPDGNEFYIEKLAKKITNLF